MEEGNTSTTTTPPEKENIDWGTAKLYDQAFEILIHPSKLAQLQSAHGMIINRCFCKIFRHFFTY